MKPLSQNQYVNKKSEKESRDERGEAEDNLQENLLRVSSVVIGEEVSPELSSSTNVIAPQVDQSLKNLKASLREEITEEVKTLVEQSQRELLLAIKSSSLENRSNNNDEILESPISVTLTPTKTVRFENANSPVNIRNMVTGVLTDPINPRKKIQNPYSEPVTTHRANQPTRSCPILIKTNRNQYNASNAQDPHDVSLNI